MRQRRYPVIVRCCLSEIRNADRQCVWQSKVYNGSLLPSCVPQGFICAAAFSLHIADHQIGTVYECLENRDKPWKHEVPAAMMMEIIAGDEWNYTYTRERADLPCEKCVTDITGIKVNNGKPYVSEMF